MITSSTVTRNTTAVASDRTALQNLAESHLAAEIGFVNNREFVELGNPLKWDLEDLKSWRSLLRGGEKATIAEETEISRLCETGLLTARRWYCFAP